VSRFKVVGDWKPKTWPRKGQRVAIPFSEAETWQAEVVEVHPDHLVSMLMGRRYIGRPKRVVDAQSKHLEPIEIWWWEEETK